MPALTQLSEGTENFSLIEELAPSLRLGFFPGTSLYSAPYPFPSSTSYPGDTIATGLSDFASISEGTETLTVITEV